MSENNIFNKNWIKNPSYTRVDLVKEGANSQAYIALIKNKGGKVMNLDQILNLLQTDQAQFIRNEITKAKNEVPAETAKSLADITKAKTDAEDKVKEMEKKAKAQANANSEQDPAELLKSANVDPALRAYMEQQIAKTKAAEESIRKMKDEQDTAEAIAKAKEIPHVVGEEAKFAGIFKKLKNTDNTLCNEVFEIFKTAETLIAKGGTFQEIGKSGEGKETGSSSDAWDKIEKKAEEISKSANIDQAAAIAKVMDEHPELYEAYLNAQNAGN